MNSVLIVIDDAQLRRSLLCKFGRQGWCVDAVDSIEAALALLSRPPRCAVLLGWQLRDGAGLLLLTAIRLRPQWSRTRVMMIGPPFEAKILVELLGAGVESVSTLTSEPLHADELTAHTSFSPYEPTT